MACQSKISLRAQCRVFPQNGKMGLDGCAVSCALKQKKGAPSPAQVGDDWQNLPTPGLPFGLKSPPIPIQNVNAASTMLLLTVGSASSQGCRSEVPCYSRGQERHRARLGAGKRGREHTVLHLRTDVVTEGLGGLRGGGADVVS